MTQKIKQKLILVTDEPIMDEEDAAKRELREAAIETMDFFKKGFRIVVQYKGNPALIHHAHCLAHGWTDLMEYEKDGEIKKCESAVDVAVKLFANPKKKAAVTKAVKLIQDALGIPPMSGQRSQQGREVMAAARKDQLKPKEGGK